MKVFVDECVTKRLMPHLIGHSFIHILDTPLRSSKNGALLRAVAPDYDVFLTTDRHLHEQQNLRKFDMAFVVIRGVTNKYEDLLPLVPDTLAALDNIAANPVTPGDLYEILPP